jgi:N-sulfoglucosamine sulfohydrolase
MMKIISSALIIFTIFILFHSCGSERGGKVGSEDLPNILFAISDDQSYAHTGFAGCSFVTTPAFDRVAREGIYFTNCYAGSPGCAPSRSSLVTGRYHWQNEQSGQHASSWMKKYVPFVDLLDENGYYTGRTGKGVAPFQYARDEHDSLWRETNAAGIAHSTIRYVKGAEDERYANEVGPVNYFENFKYFMEHREADQPFFFWYGSNEPHRAYEQDSWKRHGKYPGDVVVPGFMPDDAIIRGDMLDYAVEIDWFDLHLSRMIAYLEETGELDNTIIIVTADNGMPFPRAKANGYDYGIHVPLAIRYPAKFKGGRVVEDLVSFVDMAPTILELTGASSDGMLSMSGQSIAHILTSGKEGIVDPDKQYVFAGRERHSSSRYLNWGYPQRVVRGREHLLIWNIRPERWPAGAPQRIKPGTENELLPMYGIDEEGIHHSEWAFTDVDACPSKSYLVENMEKKEVGPYFEMSFGKRPEYELYDLKKDPFCMENVSGEEQYLEIESELKTVLLEELKKTKDPRVTGPDPEVFDSYLRYSRMREFPAPEKK